MTKQTAVFYTIHVQGSLDVAWATELYSLEIIPNQDGTTRLMGTLADQAALLGCLYRLVNLGARLISVESRRIQLNKGKVNMLKELTTTMAAEETEILAQIEKMEEGWNSGNGALYAEPFTADAHYTVWNGMYARGRATIAAQHQHIFNTVYAGTTLVFEDQSVSFLRDDVALVHLTGWIANQNGELADMSADHGSRGSRPLLVFVKNDDQWEIAAFQNTPIIDLSM